MFFSEKRFRSFFNLEKTEIFFNKSKELTSLIQAHLPWYSIDNLIIIHVSSTINFSVHVVKLEGRRIPTEVKMEVHFYRFLKEQLFEKF